MLSEDKTPEKREVKNSLEGWRNDKLLGVFYWMKALVGIAVFFMVGYFGGKISVEFYYLIAALIFIFIIIAVINYKSKK